MQCQQCQSNVQPEHIDQGKAGLWAGKMLCAVCYTEKKSGPRPAAAPAADAVPVAEAVAGSVGDEPISLVDAPTVGGAKIQTFGQQTVRGQKRAFARKAAMTGQGACRVRTFHCKIQAESLEYLDVAINDWLDANPDIEVKFATTTIGVMSGKLAEPNLIMSVWY